MLCPEEVSIVESRHEVIKTILAYLKNWPIVKARVLSKKYDNAENMMSSADTIKPYNNVIHGHRSTDCLVEEQLVLFIGIYLWKTYLLVVLDVRQMALCITNRMLSPLLVTKKYDRSGWKRIYFSFTSLMLPTNVSKY